VSWYQKSKTNLDFTEARDSELQWNPLGQVCNSLQTNNHASTPPLSFLQAGCLSCRPTNSIKALKAAADERPAKNVTSSNGVLTVPARPNIARKPGQTKHACNEQARQQQLHDFCHNWPFSRLPHFKNKTSCIFITHVIIIQRISVFSFRYKFAFTTSFM